MLWLNLFYRPSGAAFCVFGCFFALLSSHGSIIAHFKEKHKGYGDYRATKRDDRTAIVVEV